MEFIYFGLFLLWFVISHVTKDSRSDICMLIANIWLVVLFAKAGLIL